MIPVFGYYTARRLRRTGTLLPLLFLSAGGPAGRAADVHRVVLNGEWEAGLARHYDRRVSVPGVVTPTDKASPGRVWVKRTVRLPDGEWPAATLLLKGAAFGPSVWIDGSNVSSRAGGLAPTRHPLAHPSVVPGSEITLEIALDSLRDTPPDDPSYISKADHWRCNTSSWVWDDVILRTHGRLVIEKVVPVTKLEDESVEVRWEVAAVDGGTNAVPSRVDVVISRGEEAAARGRWTPDGSSGVARLEHGGACRPWSPRAPELWDLAVTVWDDDAVSDRYTMTWAPRTFRLRRTDEGHGFALNGRPVTVRGAGVVWRRWTRDEPAHDLMFDVDWFREHLVKELKTRGGNSLRWHLYTPPERFLDLCDRAGVMCEIEWHFFHEFDVDAEALREQWREWFQLIQRHPSIVFVQPYNEPVKAPTKTVMRVAEELEREYQPMLLVDRDVEDIHEYWWGMFENVGLYYDTPNIRPGRALFVGEFGGNYCDGEYNPGGYFTLPGALPRFLGRDHDAARRRWWNAAANGKIGEYFRRLGAPGISAFCVLGSWADGNHWYEGDPAEGRLKPVWDWMTPVWSPRSASLNLWNRNFLPGDTVRAPLHVINDSYSGVNGLAELRVVGMTNEVLSRRGAMAGTAPFERAVIPVEFVLPPTPGRYRLEAELLPVTPEVRHPPVSRWEVFAMTPRVPAALSNAVVAVADGERILETALRRCPGLRVVTRGGDARTTDVLVTGTETWQRLQRGDDGVRAVLTQAVSNGVPVVMLDVGGAYMGRQYPQVDNPPTRTVQVAATVPFLGGSELWFMRWIEGESHIHPTRAGGALWDGLERKQTWLWNGARGGVIVPAVDMKYVPQPAAVKGRPRRKVRGGGTALVECGVHLRRKPVIRIHVDGTPMILSQLLTSDRLLPREEPAGVYEFTYDPAAVQMVLNMIGMAVAPRGETVR